MDDEDIYLNGWLIPQFNIYYGRDKSSSPIVIVDCLLHLIKEVIKNEQIQTYWKDNKIILYQWLNLKGMVLFHFEQFSWVETFNIDKLKKIFLLIWNVETHENVNVF